MSTLTTTVRQPMGLPREMGPAARIPSVAGGGGIAANDIYRVLQQRIFLIMLVGILGSAISVGATIVTQRYFPLWTAEALIYVESPMPTNPYSPWRVALDRQTVERNLADQGSRIKDPGLLRKVLASPEVRETDWFKQFSDNVDAALSELDASLVALPLRGTSLLQVSLPTRNPKDSPRIVNKVVDLYLGDVMSWSKGQFAQDAETFETQVRLKESELRVIDDDISELEREGQIPAMLHGAPTITVRLQGLQNELVQRESDMEFLRARYEAFRQMRPEDIQASQELMARVESDPRVAGLTRHVQDLQESKSVLRTRLGERHREMQQLEAQLTNAENELAGLRQTRLVEEQAALLESYRIAYLSALQTVAELKNSVDETTHAQLDLDAKHRQHQLLTERRAKVEKERERLAEAHAEYMIVARTKEPVQISRYRLASPPLEPSRPRPILWIPLGVIASFVAAVGLALGLSFLDTSLKTPRDVIRHAGLPLLGTVPVLDDEEAAVEDIETAARVAPHSLVAECFRQIRANLLFSAPMEQQRTLLITSASSEEGKTCVAINLGVTLAQGGRRILLIDTNFRRPSLHRAFGMLNHRGLSNLLVGQGDLKPFISHTDLPNLDVLPAGPCPPNPAELLSSSYLREGLAAATEEYDQVILDGPPVLLVSDAIVLAALADGVILVCRARTSRGMVQRAKAQLGLVNSRLVGAVLNAVETTRGGYFRKYYRAFYDYQEQEGQEEGRTEGYEALPLADDKDEADALERLASNEVGGDDFQPPETDERGPGPDDFGDDVDDLTIPSDDDLFGAKDDDEPPPRNV
ncbi:MAG: polysaccharide biosynthesis tyrosine autokinase [Phycisphaerae bacterium]|nr:polysaccharide biosynthesis tyrosine autokinase [Phycisphaerae bacterium]